METAPVGSAAGTVPAVASNHRVAVLAGFLGWMLDAFDFFLVVVSLTYIAKEFNRSVPDIAFSITLTLAFRPVGAFIFGMLADRYGRRIPLMIDLVFYSIFEVLSGLAPSYWTFIVCRAMFGIGMGGEWGVGAALAMEKVPPKKRGVLSGLLQEGYAAGNLLAAACAFFILPRWGWRPLFYLGGLPALLALFVRMHVKESEVWQRSKKHETWGKLVKAVTANWKIFIYLVLLMTGMNLVSHGTQDLYPTFLEKGWGYGTQARMLLNAFTMIGAIAGGIIFGLYSDRVGRRKAMIFAMIAGFIVIPIWALTPGTAHALSFVSPAVLLYVGGFMMQFMVQGAWGVIPAHLTELSPDSIRGFLPGFAYQCGVLLASPIAEREAILGEKLGYPAAMALSISVIFVAGIIITAVGRERRGVTFGEEPLPATESRW